MITEKAYAKLNLALEVVGKRDDGFHELKSIVIPIDLHDKLEFYENDQIILESNLEIEDNLVLKTAKLMQEKYNISKGAKIVLTKNIPIGSGLGGESADIAATIRGLNVLWEMNLELDEFNEFALSLGSDTLFCLYNNPAYVYGRGEGLFFINPISNYDFYLFFSEKGISTKDVFQNYKAKTRRKKFDSLFRLYLNEQYEKFLDKTYNDLTKTVFKLNKDLKLFYYKLKKINKNVFMTGSGTALFMPIKKNESAIFIHKINKLNLKYEKSSLKT